jgi:hypothetical protein
VGSKWLLAAGTHSIRIWDFVGRQLYRVLDGSRWPMCFADGMLFAAETDVSQNIQVNTTPITMYCTPPTPKLGCLCPRTSGLLNPKT